MSSKRKERTSDGGHNNGDVSAALSGSNCSFDNVILRNVKLQNVSLNNVRLTNVTLVDVELGVSHDREETADIGLEVISSVIPSSIETSSAERHREVSVISLENSPVLSVRIPEHDLASNDGISIDGSLPVTASATPEPVVSSEQQSHASPNLTGSPALGVNESDQEDSAGDNDTSTDNSLPVTTSATPEAASTAQASLASAGSRRAEDKSDTAASSLHAPALPLSNRILRGTGPSNLDDGVCLYVRDLDYQNDDLSQYRGTRYDLQYYKQMESKLSLNRTTYVLDSRLDRDQHLNRCRDALTLYPSKYQRIQSLGSPQSLLAFLHDSRDFLQEIRCIRLHYNVKEGGSNKCEAFRAITAQIPWRHLFDFLAHNCLNLEEIELPVSSTFFKHMRITRHTTAQHFFNSKATGLLTAADRSGTGTLHEEHNFLQHLARVPRLRFHICLIGQRLYLRTDFVGSLSMLITAQMPEPRAIVQPPQCTCAAGVPLEKSCFWKIGE